MRRLKTRLEGPLLLAPTVHADERGFFVETYRRSTYGELGVPDDPRRRGRRAAGLADVRGVGGVRGHRREPPPGLVPGRFRARLLRALRGGRRDLRPERLLRARTRAGD